jgi:hypothetical protein
VILPGRPYNKHTSHRKHMHLATIGHVGTNDGTGAIILETDASYNYAAPASQKFPLGAISPRGSDENSRKMRPSARSTLHLRSH